MRTNRTLMYPLAGLYRTLGASRPVRRLTLLLVVLAALWTTPAWADDTHKVRGTFTLTESAVHTRDGQCVGSGGYDDLNSGTQVVVRNDRGRILATTRLGPGTLHGGFACKWAFTLRVPESGFYSFEVSHRGELTYSKRQLERKHWRVAFSLG